MRDLIPLVCAPLGGVLIGSYCGRKRWRAWTPVAGSIAWWAVLITIYSLV